MKKLLLLTGLCALACAGVMADDGQVHFPEGYRTWYHHHTTVNLPGHSPEANIGIQHIYANAAAREGLKTGKYADGAVFAVDRFKAVEGDNNTTKQGERKVIATMIRNATKYAQTGGWGFEAFKGGDQNQRVVKDMKNCFVCHIPYEATSFVISKGE